MDTNLIKSEDLELIKLPRYKQNLCLINNNVYSYNTNVARIKGDNLIILGYWSPTTSKHINYVAKYLNLKLINNEK